MYFYPFIDVSFDNVIAQPVNILELMSFFDLLTILGDNVLILMVNLNRVLK